MSALDIDKPAFINNLTTFIANNNVVGTTAGVCIGLATKELIQSFVGDVIIPGFIILSYFLKLDSITKKFPFKNEINSQMFIKMFITWIFVIIVTFIFIKVSFGIFLGVDVEKNNQATSSPPK